MLWWNGRHNGRKTVIPTINSVVIGARLGATFAFEANRIGFDSLRPCQSLKVSFRFKDINTVTGVYDYKNYPF